VRQPAASLCAKPYCARLRCEASQLCEHHRARAADRRRRSANKQRDVRRSAGLCADCGQPSSTYRCFGCSFQLKLARCMVASLVIAMFTGCMKKSVQSTGLSRRDAASAACAALCDWSERCRAEFQVDACERDCVALVCSSGCGGRVVDEMQFDACLDAVSELACDATDLPDPCLGVLR